MFHAHSSHNREYKQFLHFLPAHTPVRDRTSPIALLLPSLLLTIHYILYSVYIYSIFATVVRRFHIPLVMVAIDL